MSEPTADNTSEPTLAQRLGPARVGLRTDLRFFRHLFRAVPCYVVRDPLTMNCHRFTVEDYQVLVRLSAERSLADVFRELCEQGKLAHEDERDFYQFILSLHQLGFLNLPMSDDKALYRRYEAKRRSRWKQRTLGFLFLQIPLINPDAFLERTARVAAPLFTRFALFVWLALMTLAGSLAARHWQTLVHPAHSVLGGRNVPLLFVTLILLKVIHEFGHAYACKLRGGVVPEMGVFLVAFAPLAYMDATAAWGFTRKRDRLLVSLAGMYVELIVAAIALIVWATTASATTRLLAHNIVLLSSLVTVTMNANPLMRFDGYYILSDLLEIPNLRQKSQRFVRDIVKRGLFRTPVAATPQGVAIKVILFSFGVASSIYKATVVLSIAAVIATKVYLIGLGMAVFYVGGQVLRLLRSTTTYLWRSPEVAACRARAVMLSVLLLAGVPAGLLLIPVRSTVQAHGQLVREHEHVVRAAHEGVLKRVAVAPGDRVEPHTVMFELENPVLIEAMIESEAQLSAAELRARALIHDDPVRARAQQQMATAVQAQVVDRQKQLEQLKVQPGVGGQVIECLTTDDEGRFVSEGFPMATVASGRWRVRTLVTAQDLAATGVQPGQVVEVRCASDPSHAAVGTITRIQPAGSRRITLPSLTQLGGGEIVVAPADSQADRPYFELVVELENPPERALRQGGTATIRLPCRSQPLGQAIYRRLLRFLDVLDGAGV